MLGVQYGNRVAVCHMDNVPLERFRPYKASGKLYYQRDRVCCYPTHAYIIEAFRKEQYIAGGVVSGD